MVTRSFPIEHTAPQSAECSSEAGADAFRNAQRVQESITARMEKKVLLWIAARLPLWVTSDQLTCLGLSAMLFGWGSYLLARWYRSGFLLATIALALNWFGDSLDGTLARVRDQQRPRYGFYVDHVIDSIGAVLLMTGLAASGCVDWRIAAAMLVGFLLLSIESYLASYTIGVFRMSFWKFGPTEIRILLALGNLALWWNPHATVFGRFRLFDFGGAIAAALMLAMFLASAIRHTAHLYRAEPVVAPGQLPRKRNVGLTALLIALLIGPSSSPAQLERPGPRPQQPLWSIAPRKVGYDPRILEKFLPKVGVETVKIMVADEQRLAVAWLTPDEASGRLVGPETSVPSHLHLVILEARTGRKISSNLWPCSSAGVNIAYLPSGQWLLAKNQSISLYSQSFQELRELDRVNAPPTQFTSPSGRTFLLHVANPEGRPVTQLRDSATFAVVDSWDDTRIGGAPIVFSDSFALALVFRWRRPRDIYVRRVRGDWEEFPNASSAAESHPGTPPTGFANDDTVVSALGHTLVVRSVGGAELFRSALGQKLFLPSWSTSATSAGARRFAVILARFRGIRWEAADMYPFLSDDRVVIYSIPKERAVFTVKVRGPSPWWFQIGPFAWNSIALSPRGELLAIASSEGVKVYRVPAD